MLSFFRTKSRTRLTKKSSTPRARLNVEALESRLVPYALSGAAWAQPQLITIGFVPDGTDLGGVSSNLVSSFNSRFGSQSAWQNAILKAAQVWAQQTNLNFALVTDNGASIGSGGWIQGDPNMADIRIGGYNFGTTTLGRAYLPPSTNNFSIAGDIQLNTNQAWVLGTTGGYDVFTVAMHEFGHALGLLHSSNYFAALYPSYTGVRSGLGSDDTSGIRALYSLGQARTHDLFDLVAPNNTLSTASYLDLAIDSDTKTALVTDLDITTTTDVDYWTFAAPTGTSGTMQVKVQSAGLSMLQGSFGLYNQSLQLVGFATGAGQYGSSLTMTVHGVTAGQRFYLCALSADTASPFGTGKYALALNFATAATPTVPLSSAQTSIGYPLVGGSGVAVEDGFEYLVSTAGSGLFTVGRGFAEQATAMDDEGNSVVVWAGYAIDGSGHNVYARLYNSAGEARGDAFLVSNTVAGMQMNATVAMGDAGDFVVTWSGLDAEGWKVYARRFDAAGVARGDEFQVGGVGAVYPSVAVDADGDFVIAWAQADGGVVAQRFNAAGEAQTDPFAVSSSTTSNQSCASVALDNEGNFVVTWSSYNPDGDGWDVYARLFDAAGVARGDEFRVSTTAAGNQMYSSVAADAVGNFVIAWIGPDGDGSGVYARRFDAAGVALGDEFLANSTLAGDQSYASVAMGSAGGFVVTWTTNGQDGDGTGIYARHYNAIGEAQGDEFLVNTTTVGGQYASSAAMNAAGDFIIAWHGNGYGGPTGVFAQRFVVVPEGAKDEFDPEGYDHHAHEHEAGCGCESCASAINAYLADDSQDNQNEDESADALAAWQEAYDLLFAADNWSIVMAGSSEAENTEGSEQPSEDGDPGEPAANENEALVEEQPA